MVLTPTRELAVQISEQFGALGALMGLRHTVVIGGVGILEQSLALSGATMPALRLSRSASEPTSVRFAPHRFFQTMPVFGGRLA